MCVFTPSNCSKQSVIATFCRPKSIIAFCNLWVNNINGKQFENMHGKRKAIKKSFFFVTSRVSVVNIGIQNVFHAWNEVNINQLPNCSVVE